MVVPLRAAAVAGSETACSPFVIAGDEPVLGQSGHRIGRWPQEARAGSARGGAAIRGQTSGVTATRVGWADITSASLHRVKLTSTAA